MKKHLLILLIFALAISFFAGCTTDDAISEDNHSDTITEGISIDSGDDSKADFDENSLAEDNESSETNSDISDDESLGDSEKEGNESIDKTTESNSNEESKVNNGDTTSKDKEASSKEEESGTSSRDSEPEDSVSQDESSIPSQSDESSLPDTSKEESDDEEPDIDYEPSTPIDESQDPYLFAFPFHLLSYDGKVYLGKLVTNPFDVDSIWNEYSLYGSKYGVNSIWNPYSLYGSQFSITSAFNIYATRPPVIVDSTGDFIGYLTTNEYLPYSYTVDRLYASLYALGQ